MTVNPSDAGSGGRPTFGQGGGSANANLVGWYGADGKLAVATQQQVAAQLVDWYKTSPKTFASVAKVLKAAGYSNDGTFGTVYPAWKKAATDASLVQDTMGLTDFLAQSAGDRSAFKTPKKTAYMGPTSETQITSSFDANAIADDALAKYLGRDATDDQKAEFRRQLNSAEQANPLVRTPNGKHAATTTGGFDSTATAALAEDFAKSQGDFAETQAATTGLAWMSEAIKGGGRLI